MLNIRPVLGQRNHILIGLVLKCFQTNQPLCDSNCLSFDTCVGYLDLRRHIRHIHHRNTTMALLELLVTNRRLVVQLGRFHRSQAGLASPVLATDCKHRQCRYLLYWQDEGHHGCQHMAPLLHRGHIGLDFD